MADKNIGALPQVPQLMDDSLMVVEQQGQAMKMTGRQFREFGKQAVMAEVQELVDAAETAAESAVGAVKAVTDMTVEAEALAVLEQGVDIGDDKPTLPAVAKVNEQGELLLTIREGRYHQVKRMLRAVDNEVLYLKRLSFGSLVLPEDLEAGAFRALKEEEKERLRHDISG